MPELALFKKGWLPSGTLKVPISLTHKAEGSPNKIHALIIYTLVIYQVLAFKVTCFGEVSTIERKAR